MATVLAAPPSLTIEEYLRTSYKPDADFVDGHIEERSLGEREHARLQALLIATLISFEQQGGFVCCTGQRMRVSPTRVRVADIALVAVEARHEEVLRTPPLLCLEIMSSEDRLSRAINVLQDYRSFGVPEIWLIDPNERVVYTYGQAGLQQQEDMILQSQRQPVALQIGQLFGKLNAERRTSKQ